MPIISQLDIKGGDLWEAGVLIPIKNPNMEVFEESIFLQEDAKISHSAINVSRSNIENRALNDSVITIGPSTDTSKDSNGDFLYYGKQEIFLIDYIYLITGNYIFLKSYANNYPSTLQYQYLKGDPVTIRGIAKNWTKLSSGIFPSLSYTDSGLFRFSREETLDDLKGYSQGIQLREIGLTETYQGIYQYITGRGRQVLNEIKDGMIRMSAWIKSTVSEQTADYEDAIDENIAGPQGDDIDENISGPKSNDIEENFAGSLDSMTLPRTILRSVFFNDTEYSSVVDSADYSVDSGELSSSLNHFIYDIVRVPEQTLSAIIGVYSYFPSNEGFADYKLFIDDVIIEHCIGTSKEDDGFYKFDLNPGIGLTSDTYNDPNLSSSYLGRKSHNSRGDTLSRFKIEAEWLSRPGYFVNDMLILKEWNNRGFPIVLRTKMPGVLPATLFCDIDVSIVPVEGSKGTELSDVKIIFEEISVL